MKGKPPPARLPTLFRADPRIPLRINNSMSKTVGCLLARNDRT